MKKKNNNQDFTYESLPKTRREQFFQILRDNFPLLLKIGLFCLLFLLPFLVSFFLKESYQRSLGDDLSLTVEKQQSMMISFEIIFNAIYIPCLMVFFVGLGGVLKILRRLIWNEPIFFKEDFLLGLKDNFGQSILIGFLIGVLNLISVVMYYLLSSDYRYISYIFVGISLAVIVPILIIALYLSSIYQNKFKASMKVSGRLFIRRGFLYILPLLLIYAMYFISLIPLGTIYVSLIYIVLFVFVLPLIILLSYIIDFKVVDDYINTYYYPDKAYLGLYISEEKRKEIDQKVLEAQQENMDDVE